MTFKFKLNHQSQRTVYGAPLSEQMMGGGSFKRKVFINKTSNEPYQKHRIKC